MNRQSMAAQADLAKATENYIKELKRLRNQHGFGTVRATIEEDGDGATVDLKVELHLDLEFNLSGDLEDEWRQEKLVPVESATKPSDLVT